MLNLILCIAKSALSAKTYVDNKKMKWMLLIATFPVFSGWLWAESGEELEKSDWEFYQNVRELWMKGDYDRIEDLLTPRVILQILPDYWAEPDYWSQQRYYRDQARDILKWYFEKIEVLEFRYDPKRMSETRGMAIYHYRMKETGVVHEKRLYLYLRLEKVDVAGEPKAALFINAIREIGSPR